MHDGFGERRREDGDFSERVEKKLDDLLSTQYEMKTKQAVIANVVDNVLIQATKTNGRVLSIEIWKENKNGEIRVICWTIGIIFAAVVSAWIKIGLYE